MPRRRTLLVAFAMLAGVADAAGPRTEQGNAQNPADASQLALANITSDSLYDYRSLKNGGSYYAPGSYGSWFYVAPPTGDATVASATYPVRASAPRTPPPALPTYYDYDRFRGPLFA